MTNITKAAQDALDRMDALISPANKLLAIPSHSATQLAAFADMATIRAALQDNAGEVSRYQAIRDGMVYIEPYESGEIYVAGESGVYTKSGAEFDSAIDAIAASQQKGGQ